jgi:hypothetical protein
MAMALNLNFYSLKIMFLDFVIGRRGITIQLAPSILAKNIIFKSILLEIDWLEVATQTADTNHCAEP